MKTEARVAIVTFATGAALGLACLPLWVSASENGHDHVHADKHEHEHSHAHDHDLDDQLPSPPAFDANAPNSPVPSNGAPAYEPPQATPYSTWPTERLYKCRWRTQTTDNQTGGVFALCEHNEVPVGNGLHRGGFPFVDGHHLHNLGFGDRAPEADGSVDGEWLADSHPDIHGEPPTDGRTAANYTLMTHDRGTGKHHIFDGVYESHKVTTLCCEVSP